MTVCSRCVYDSEKIPELTFDSKGVCQFCKLSDEMAREYKTGTPEGRAMLMSIVDDIKQAGKGNEIDCVVGFSGGSDSSYMLDWAVRNGLKPLAVTYNNGWNKNLANENIKKLINKLGIKSEQVAPDIAEINDIFKAFLSASVIDLDSSSDIALAEVLYRKAAEYGVKYILEGHSFTTEGISPLNTLYMDGRYIKSVHDLYGKVPLVTFPNMTLWAFLNWTLFKGIRKIRPFWYIRHSKEYARDYLVAKYDWNTYSGIHCENVMTEFHHNYYVYNKFGFDGRANGLAALVRDGLMYRTEALNILNEPPQVNEELLEEVLDRLELSKNTLSTIMRLPKKTYRDYKTYKDTFHRMKPLFYILARSNLVPMSFYMKYCKE